MCWSNRTCEVLLFWVCLSKKNHHLFLNKWWATAVFVRSSKKKRSPRSFTPQIFPLCICQIPPKTKKKNKGGQKTMSCPSRSTCSDFTACPSTVTRPAAMEALDLTWWRPQLVGGDCFQAISKDTLPETNSLPLKVGRCPKGNFIFQPLSFQGLCC